MTRGNLSTTAQRLADHFYTADNGRVCFDADEPDHDTLLDMTFAASNAGLSSDYAYSMVRDVLQLIADTEPDDVNDTDVSSLVDVYNADLMRFISDGTHWTFADEALEEWGGAVDDFIKIVALAQDFAYRAALNAVISEWPDDEDDEDDAE